MIKLHIDYQAVISSGIVEISAGYDTSLMDKNNESDFYRRYVIRTEKSPTTVLKELEKLILERTNDRVSTRDIFQGTSYDSTEEYCNHPRLIGFLPSVPWSDLGYGKEDPEERERIDERNTNRHEKIYPIYEEFVLSYKSKK